MTHTSRHVLCTRNVCGAYVCERAPVSVRVCVCVSLRVCLCVSLRERVGETECLLMLPCSGRPKRPTALKVPRLLSRALVVSFVYKQRCLDLAKSFE